ncbi:GNAT family N-acetyltransferase [Kribbella monticola]|uniref:GNAT family N-acetyltransferase n=1 Tax=Kribbella monticola TaxID=2185285 RepID=UPI001E2F5491|nr:GNAT family N-acetyltransferase [Kribbella monticola]
MHADEAEIDETLVLRLIAAQFPQWAGLPVSEIPSSGTVNAMYRLGDSLTVRLPRIAGGVADIAAEWEWLPRLADVLPVEIPAPVGRGEPGEGYPWIWSVQRWIPGAVPAAGDEVLAADLASFVQAFRRIDFAGGPAAHRGGPLTTQDAETRDALEKLAGWIDTDTATAVWESALAAAPASSECWVHGDLMPSNLLVRDGRLAAVLDFATAGMGDPACDLIPAWNLLTGSARAVFREALAVDEDAWNRGRGRALSMALIQLPYYRDTNKGIAANAQYVIDEVLADFGAVPRPKLRIERVDSEALMRDWQLVHNEIIPTDPLSLDDVRERVGRNVLEVAYSGEDLVGCSTVRPPSAETSAVTVIARILPAYRRQGFGEELYRRGLARARALGSAIETIVLASNVEGLAFAESHGFVEFERYVLPGDTIPFITLRLADQAS